MTVGDLPVASATPRRSIDRARVSARARARVATTFGDGNTAAKVRAVVVSDLRRWWLHAARPPSLKAWRRTQRVAIGRVPGDNALLRRLWVLDNWTFGLLVRWLATAMFLAAAGLAWLALHPTRRWFALLVFTILAIGLMAN